MDGSGMMWGMGTWGLIATLIVVLLIAVLIKYVFFR